MMPTPTERYLFYCGGSTLFEFELRRISLNEQNPVSTRIYGEAGLSVQAVATDRAADKLYAAVYNPNNDQTTIRRLNYDGTPDGPNDGEVLSFAGDLFGELTLADNKLYWANAVSNTISSVNLDGTGFTVLFDQNDGINMDGGEGPYGIGVDLEVSDDFVYWTEVTDDQVVRGNKDGSGDPTVLFDASDGLAQPYGLEVHNNLLYIADDQLTTGPSLPNDRILVGNKGGTGNLTVLIPAGNGVEQIVDLVLDQATGKLYWANVSGSGSQYSISTANLDGSGISTLLEEVQGVFVLRMAIGD
ncbi:MAG: hypothetical protein HC880_08300 [Bacteroidia bacterium]|nr:hypothetical protein [Bacteroidia bacterium]